MNNPHSFIICNISIEYPKRRLFDIFEQKKICIIESIEFVLSEDQYCYAIVYVANWYCGKLCMQFLEKLKKKGYVELIDCNHYVWKIVSTPTIMKEKPKWFQMKKIHDDNHSDSVIIKIKSKPNSIPREYMEHEYDQYTENSDHSSYDGDNDSESSQYTDFEHIFCGEKR